MAAAAVRAHIADATKSTLPAAVAFVRRQFGKPLQQQPPPPQQRQQQHHRYDRRLPQWSCCMAIVSDGAYTTGGSRRCVLVLLSSGRGWRCDGWRWQRPVPLPRARVFRKYAVLSWRRRLWISVYYYLFFFPHRCVVVFCFSTAIPSPPPMPSFRHAKPAVHGPRTVYHNTVYVNSARCPRPGAPAAAVRRCYALLCATIMKNYKKKKKNTGS